MKRVILDTNIYGRIIERGEADDIGMNVVSDDNDTMRSSLALTAFEVVNKIKRYRMPQFIGYETFGRLLS